MLERISSKRTKEEKLPSKVGNQFNLNNFFKESPLDHWLELKIVENKQEIKSRWKRNKFCFLLWDNKMLVHDLYESMTSWPVHLFQDQSLRNINYLKTKRFPQVFMFWKSWTRLDKIARERDSRTDFGWATNVCGLAFRNRYLYVCFLSCKSINLVWRCRYEILLGSLLRLLTVYYIVILVWRSIKLIWWFSERF